MRTNLLVATVGFVLIFSVAKAECFGEGSYRVCSDSYQDSNGDFHVRSSDTEGNSYSVDSTTRQPPGGGSEIRSDDSDGNSCTITNSGTMIGCGE